MDAYFERIGYDGPRAPTRETLDALLLRQVTAIPFENLDVLLGRTISIESEAVREKLIGARRGGYCFELNGLLLDVLGQLGYAVTPVSARVRWQKPREFTPPRTHVFLRVELDGQSWLVDAGVGGLSLTAAIRLLENEEQVTPHDRRRLVHDGRRWFHQVSFGDGWRDVCEFTLEEMPRIDRELANWFTSTHPQSHFKDQLIVARATADGGRLSLANFNFTRRFPGGSSETRTLGSPEELLGVLAEEFGLSFPAGTRFRESALKEFSYQLG